MGEKSVQKSKFLCFAYGDCYDEVLTEECVCMDSESRGGKWKLALRLVALALVVTNLVFASVFFPLFPLLIFLTNWAMELTLVLVVIVIWSSFDENINQKKGWLSAIHILAEISFMANFVTVVVYWPVLHKGALEKYKDHDMKILHTYLIHSCPSIALLIIFATTDIRMRPQHGKIFLLIGSIYSVTNLIGTKIRGSPLYPFLTWEDYISPLVCTAVTLGSWAIHVFFAKLSIRLNQRSKAKSKVN